MAYERNPNDPSRADDLYRPKNPSRASDPNRADPSRSNPADDEYRRAARIDSELQPDPELAEGPAGSGRIALFAIAVAVVLGAVFYGLNNSSINQAGTSSIAQKTTQSSSPPANTSQGTTTGAAPAREQAAPSSAPTGQDMNRSGNPPTDNAAPANNTAPNK